MGRLKPGLGGYMELMYLTTRSPRVTVDFFSKLAQFAGSGNAPSAELF